MPLPRGCGAELAQRIASPAPASGLPRCGRWPSWRIPNGHWRGALPVSPMPRGKTLTRAADAITAHALTLHFSDGRVEATAGAADPKSPPSKASRVERKPRAPYVPPQPSLFDDGEE